MFQLSYDAQSCLATAITTGEYDSDIAKKEMHEIIALPNLQDKLRVLRIFSNVTFEFDPNEVNEHFAYVQDCLNKTHLKTCLLAIVTDKPLNTALGFLYQSNQSSGSCHYTVKVFSTQEAAIAWLLAN